MTADRIVRREEYLREAPEQEKETEGEIKSEKKEERERERKRKIESTMIERYKNPITNFKRTREKYIRD